MKPKNNPIRKKTLRKQRETLKALKHSNAKTMLEFQKVQEQKALERENRRQAKITKQRREQALRLAKSNRLFSPEQIRHIRESISIGASDRGLARHYGCSAMTIRDIRKGVTYRDVK